MTDRLIPCKDDEPVEPDLSNRILSTRLKQFIAEHVIRKAKYAPLLENYTEAELKLARNYILSQNLARYNQV